MKVAIDIDGCITQGKGKLVNAEALLALSHAVNNSFWQLHLCSGRSAPYVEAVAQVTGIADWAICENGAYIYHPLTDEIHYNPAITDTTRAALSHLSQQLSQEPYRSISRLELGKALCISLNPIGMNITELLIRLKQNIDTDYLYINHSTTAVDITPKGVNYNS